MTTRWFTMPRLILGAAMALAITTAHFTARAEESSAPEVTIPSTDDPQIEESQRVSVDVARDRAKVMHDIHAATLEALHHHYFHRERAVVPARAMEDVFKEIQQKSKVESRWMSVNMKPMSVGHEPKSDFEKQAATEIAAGKPDVEIVEGGYYRRATPIPLGDGCVGCHGGFFKENTKSPKFAGLVISVPVRSE